MAICQLNYTKAVYARRVANMLYRKRQAQNLRRRRMFRSLFLLARSYVKYTYSRQTKKILSPFHKK